MPATADTLSAKDFARILNRRRANYPTSDAYPPAPAPWAGTWYSSQKEHVVGWLNELDGPGAYGRKTRGLGAKHMYTHFQCAPGLLWVAEALGESAEVVRLAADNAADVWTGGGRAASECAAIRRIIPWSRIAELLEGDLGLWAVIP